MKLKNKLKRSKNLNKLSYHTNWKIVFYLVFFHDACWFLSCECLKHLFENFRTHRLRNDLINLAGPRHIDECLFDVAGAGDNHRLRHIGFEVEISNLLAELKAIHYRHADVS